MGLELDRYQKIQTIYENFLRTKLQNSEDWYNMGLAYLKLKEYQKAIDFFEKVVEIHPEGKKAWHKMILIFIKLHKYEQAKKCFRVQRALETKLGDSVKSVLKKIMMAEPGINGVLLTDGFGDIISQLSKPHFPLNKNSTEVGATSSAIFNGTEFLGRIANFSELDIVLAEFDKAKVYYCRTSHNKIVTIFGERDVCLGLIRLIMKSTSSEFTKIFMDLLDFKRNNY